jgi:hypothetical protein
MDVEMETGLWAYLDDDANDELAVIRTDGHPRDFCCSISTTEMYLFLIYLTTHFQTQII